MLTKKQFLERLDFIKKYETRMNNFDKALQKFAKSDFTGFYDEITFGHLCDCLKEDMNDKYDTISWWMCDLEWGTRKDMCNIYHPETGEVIATVDTPEALYDYLFIENTKTPPKEQMMAIVKAQDNGVKCALKVLDTMRNTNENTHNAGWAERNALLRYASDKIEHEYRFERGIGADLDIKKDFYIVSMLEEEG